VDDDIPSRHADGSDASRPLERLRYARRRLSRSLRLYLFERAVSTPGGIEIHVNDDLHTYLASDGHGFLDSMARMVVAMSSAVS
jgi:hypothetical protein